MATEKIEERVDGLESALAAFIRHSDDTVAELRQASRQASAEARQASAETRQIIDELRNGSAETRQIIDELRNGSVDTHYIIDELRQDIAEMRQWRVQSQKQWGEIAQKMGTFVEDIVAPNIPRLGRDLFKLGGPEEELFSGPRLRVRHPSDPSRTREFDFVYAAQRGWIVVESKNDPKLKDVDVFREMLSEAREFFPQYAHIPLHPIFSSLYLSDHVVHYCTRHRIHALGMGPETMQVLNLDELPPAPVTP